MQLTIFIEFWYEVCFPFNQNFTAESSSLLRCKERSGQLNIWREACGQRHIVEPENYYEVRQNLELAEAGVLAGSGGRGSGFYEGRAIQMKPQSSGMKLRIRKYIYCVMSSNK